MAGPQCQDLRATLGTAPSTATSPPPRTRGPASGGDRGRPGRMFLSLPLTSHFSCAVPPAPGSACPSGGSSHHRPRPCQHPERRGVSVTRETTGTGEGPGDWQRPQQRKGVSAGWPHGEGSPEAAWGRTRSLCLGGRTDRQTDRQAESPERCRRLRHRPPPQTGLEANPLDGQAGSRPPPVKRHLGPGRSLSPGSASHKGDSALLGFFQPSSHSPAGPPGGGE